MLVIKVKLCDPNVRVKSMSAGKQINLGVYPYRVNNRVVSFIERPMLRLVDQLTSSNKRNVSTLYNHQSNAGQ